jgi:type II secretory pathway pseudopilin PulG
MRTSSAQSGFTLVEALLAATLLTLALLLGMGLVLEQPRIVRRLDAQRRAIESLETTLELMRAGVIPLQSQRIDSSGGLAVWVSVEPAGYPPGLWDVSARAVWTVEGQTRQRSVETMVWRPEP